MACYPEFDRFYVARHLSTRYPNAIPRAPHLVEGELMRKLPMFRAIKRKLALTANNPADKSQCWIPKPGIGMVSPEEMRFYYESAARYVGKKGAVVDLGCWLGSTSVAL